MNKRIVQKLSNGCYRIDYYTDTGKFIRIEYIGFKDHKALNIINSSERRAK